MRLLTSTLNGAIRQAAQTPSLRTSQAQALRNMRQYSTENQPKKGGLSNGLLLGLLGVGVVGGIAYNKKQGKACPLQEGSASVFKTRGFASLKLLEIQPVNHNTSLFRFALPEGQTSGLPVASCVIAKHSSGGFLPVLRPYTPISDEKTSGHIDFMIKKYDNGAMTPLIHNMKPGDTLEFKGPMSKYDWERNQRQNVGMIAGGTGITPMLQLIRRIFREDSTDKNVKVSLIYANQTEQDILLKSELDEIAKKHPDRFKVVYALDTAPTNWTGVSGFVNKEVIQEHLPGPQVEDSVIFVCGPPPMVKSIAGETILMSQGKFGGILKELGYSKNSVFKF
ncbi:NADH-cytochrome b5 reductase 2 [Mucor ambiguus]|uniref:NADH-cytochrome b5 reductase n=1 Tax=Mucor ambiguus TaxID=91626 RepID=A0A0C9MNE7_9FUNG|nr:NADH-cytochrome b5 reductase 2 [Mucor ambiguus]